MMSFPICQFIIVTFYFQMVYSEVTLLPNECLPIKCGNDLKLRCQYSGTSSCCGSSTRSWRRDGVQIMNNGAESSTTGKYIETVVSAENYFELTIKNTNESDAGIRYGCVYGFDTSDREFSNNELKCGRCGECGLKLFFWSWIGTYYGSVNMMLFILITIWKNNGDNEHESAKGKHCTKYLLVDGVTTNVASLAVNALLGALIGIFTCNCYDNALPCDVHVIYMLLGFAVLVIMLPILACCNVFKTLTCKDVCILIVIIILGPLGIIGYTAYIWYIKKKTWQDVDWKDVGIMLLTVITHGIPIFLACTGWPTKKKAQCGKKTSTPL